ncbi:CU044_2847 family protein [Kitasatospora cheerisanensis]|uniref:CU044_2847 family protein n=1 Tax=Kitasatospora cheerisanensis TaxID=81942 RepID=UPI0007C59C22|nr:CU044_2847 family protein [Kitasatospora cheerisanensis]
MTEYIELGLSDDTSIMLRVFPIGPGAARPADGKEQAEDADWGRPPDLVGAVPVSSGAGARTAALARDALRLALKPLVPLLQEVHDTVAAVPARPDEVSVEFGVQFGADLKLGIVGGKAEATMTVSATWKLPPAPPALPAQPAGS